MYIAIDVGGTNMRIALVDLSKEDAILKIESHPVSQDYAVGIEEMMNCIAQVSAGQVIEGIGACFPGILDEYDMIITANNLPDWTHKPIKETLEERFKKPVKLTHDVMAAAVGEALFGSARGRSSFVYIIWGTGVGACDVRRVNDGSYFMLSFENGHHILEWNGKTCTCGQRGCAETYLGGDMLRDYFREDMRTVKDEDPRWDFVAEKAAHAFLNTLLFHPVDLIILGGGVITKRPFLLERAKAIMSRELTVFPMPEMVLAAKGEHSALYGCAGLFRVKLIG